MEKLYVIKIGGNIIDEEKRLSSFLKLFAAVKENKILVHGGGKLATQLAEKLNIPQKMVDGRRITDEETLKLAIMVYAGYINKIIIAKLQSNRCNAIGLSGTDGNSILSHKRNHPTIDYGFVGDIDNVNSELLNDLLSKNHTPVIAPLTHDGKGQLLNTNADTIAQEIAKAMSDFFEVSLIYCFEKKGVLGNINDETSVIEKIDYNYYLQLKSSLPGAEIFSGMIPKLDNAFIALKSGVKKVIIGKAEDLDKLIDAKSGTIIINE